ncbi:MAG: hypothetical protein JWP31_403 [Aeromicrobium sp.]|nr:hypothetical protein [Aeromicrobium sp.]
MRTPARALAVAVAFVVTFIVSTGAAFADQPTGDAWADGPEKSRLDLLILFGGGTVGLFVLIALFGLLTARNNYVPPPPGTEVEKVGDHTPAHH